MRTKTSRENYLDTVFGVTDSALAAVRATMDVDGLAGMSIGPHEARLLQFLIRGFGVRSVVEIGTLAGYSALAMAAALPADGRLITIERDEERCAAARANVASLRMTTKVDVRRGEALGVLATLSGDFDMVFIDANKREYPRYLDWAERHVRAGGLIVGDNTFLWGAVYGEAARPSTGAAQTAAMIEFNARLADPGRYDAIMVPTAEGMTVARKLY